jgi:hypothetical protein
VDSPASDVVTPSVSDLELTLKQVRGVYASRVIMDGQRQLCEIHIIATDERRPKQIIRDIETILCVKHGLRIDYRKVSLVQLAVDDLRRLPLARPEIRRVDEENLGEQRRIRVEISGAGRIVHGEANERIDSATPFYSAARATVECVEKLVGRQIDVRVEHATALRLDAYEIAIVVLSCWIEDREEKLVGASFVGSRPAESAARATLDALNRRIFTLNIQAEPPANGLPVPDGPS